MNKYLRLTPWLLSVVAASVAAQAAPNEIALRATETRLRTNCAAIAPGESETGLIFNPEGMHTMYLRSACYQNLAVQLGDASLCDFAIERKSVLFDGSGISPKACRRLVAEQEARDKVVAAGVRPQSVISLSLLPNGNGRDYEMLIGMSGGSSYPHRRIITLVAPREVVLNDMTQPLGPDGGELRHTLSGTQLAEAIGGGGSFSIRVEFRLEPRDVDQQRLFRLAGPWKPAARTLTCRWNTDVNQYQQRQLVCS